MEGITLGQEFFSLSSFFSYQKEETKSNNSPPLSLFLSCSSLLPVLPFKVGGTNDAREKKGEKLVEKIITDESRGLKYKNCSFWKKKKKKKKKK